MGTFYLTEPYCFVRKESERLKIFKDRKLVKEVKVNDFTRFFINEETTFTTEALLLIAQKGKEIVYFSGNDFAGRLIGAENKNVRLRISQVEAHLSEEQSLLLARQFVLGKIHNSRITVQRFARRRKLDLTTTLDNLKKMMNQCLEAKNIDQIRGIEGNAAKEYFGVLPQFITAKGFPFHGRSKRPAKDAINSLLNYGYSLLRAEVTGALFSAGLDPYIGFLHRERYGRESLALDVMEEFRSILVDNLVIRLVNLGMIRPIDFTDQYGEPRLTDDARRQFLKEFDQRRLVEVTHPFLQKRYSYREIIQKQAILLAKYLKKRIR